MCISVCDSARRKRDRRTGFLVQMKALATVVFINTDMIANGLPGTGYVGQCV